MSLNPSHNILLKKPGLILVILLITSINYGQTTTYNQFWNEIQFTRTISEKWSTELNLAATYSSTESSSNIFQQNTQRSVRAGDIITFLHAGNYLLFSLTIITKMFRKLANSNLRK